MVKEKKGGSRIDDGGNHDKSKFDKAEEQTNCNTNQARGEVQRDVSTIEGGVNAESSGILGDINKGNLVVPDRGKLCKEGEAITKEKANETFFGTRCSPPTLKSFLEGLSETKRDLVSALGLGGLLELRIESNRILLVMELMRRFNWETRVLHVHGQHLLLTEGVVGRLLGLPCCGREVRAVKTKARSLEVKYGLTKISRSALVEKLKGIVNDNIWQANFIMLVENCFLSPSSSLDCTPARVGFFEDVSELKELNWSKYVLDGLCFGVRDLKKQLKKMDDGEKISIYMKGCVVLLELFYVEHIDCGMLKTGWVHRQTPRLLDWDDDAIHKVYSRVKYEFDDETVELFSSEALPDDVKHVIELVNASPADRVVMEMLQKLEMKFDIIVKELKCVSEAVTRVESAMKNRSPDSAEEPLGRSAFAKNNMEKGETTDRGGVRMQECTGTDVPYEKDGQCDDVNDESYEPQPKAAPKSAVLKESVAEFAAGTLNDNAGLIGGRGPQEESGAVAYSPVNPINLEVGEEPGIGQNELDSILNLAENADNMGGGDDFLVVQQQILNVSEREDAQAADGRERIMTRSTKVDMRVGGKRTAPGASVVDCTISKRKRAEKFSGLRDTSDLKKGKAQKAPYVPPVAEKGKAHHATRSRKYRLTDSGDENFLPPSELLDDPLNTIYDCLMYGNNFRPREEVFSCDDEFATREDLQCLLPTYSLNETVINSVVYLLSKEQNMEGQMQYYWHLPTFFSQMVVDIEDVETINLNNMVKSFRRNKPYTGEITNLNMICIPMNHKIVPESAHWYLFVVDPSSRKGFILDSMRLLNQQERIEQCRKMLRFLNIWIAHSSFDTNFLYTKPDFSSFAIEVVNVRQQSNIYDCGVYVVQWMRLIYDFRALQTRSFDSNKSPVRRELLQWICAHPLNKLRDDVFKGAVSYQCLKGRKQDLKEAKALRSRMGVKASNK